MKKPYIWKYEKFDKAKPFEDALAKELEEKYGGKWAFVSSAPKNSIYAPLEFWTKKYGGEYRKVDKAYNALGVLMPNEVGIYRRTS